MKDLCARDVMHPRVSLPAKMAGAELIEKLTGPYPGLPVVSDSLEVEGIVSEYDVLAAIKEGRTVHEFSAESLMTCGHAEHGACGHPVSVAPDSPLTDVIDLFLGNGQSLSVLPVVSKRKLVGIIARKNLMNALAERGFWPEHEFQKRL
ncbi:MAG TPA: CBS domain-containing protein [bacterium]